MLGWNNWTVYPSEVYDAITKCENHVFALQPSLFRAALPYTIASVHLNRFIDSNFVQSKREYITWFHSLYRVIFDACYLEPG
jgi:hypothetical protein